MDQKHQDEEQLAAQMKLLGIRGRDELRDAESFYRLLQEIQHHEYDFGLAVDKLFALPAKISKGSVLQAKTVAANKAADTRKLARTLMTDINKFLDSLEVTQKTQWKALVTAKKFAAYTGRKRSFDERRAQDRRDQQALASQLTQFTMPTIAQLIKKPRVNRQPAAQAGQQAAQAGQQAAQGQAGQQAQPDDSGEDTELEEPDVPR